MKILGIDYGRKKIGLAIADGSLSEPLRVIRYIDIKILGEQIKQIVKREKIEKIIVGISEGKMAEETEKFLSAIRYTLSPVPVETFDETLSTHTAQELSREVGMSRKKRKNLEDAYAAAVMLQNYLDSKE
ncbi:Holliday junction resolvase RuvX [Candidatus Woesebacteria bacterium CG22_combo_CG10-13_8_21_14_all_39_10]|uniref:Putative pre-16S rRNA nuclease n=4 Tax=Candidatus Woeseibacteriota TaxID=1752722 RepID=A0A2M7XA28_9BACT|nr:Holliday junction resolvase RuvX [Candidatus Microgenomates bacterium]PIP57624.1 MAG: Holliday junction resolvase RuvX [Candidatus Woesebacteria bacterium CG22_combo_CG10-13_8_21_14_all_39_10]PIU71896.1 MAG: Holliday junction resolvase RuvX [Candidatus Woesebacteria bacterium CG06_land_8_20_14_3_00_39_27]PIZ46620.1 MAG: Holliday junction resolvase RuvX [Candidatus Woesebacteria bacterium CG_4_10_14_0_2_um_filter_39_14]PJA43008.1 MAG: Holliday junction resolvase RuvX [Candidatus Woesebacteria